MSFLDEHTSTPILLTEQWWLVGGGLPKHLETSSIVIRIYL
jgi:hypothetical protein